MSSSVSTVVLLMSSLGTVPVEAAVDDFVDLIEVNHFYDKEGNRVFDQLIFYDWSPAAGRFQVRAWRMLKKVQQEPQRDWKTSIYKIIFDDQGTLRKVRSASIRHTWTQFDPEIAERAVLPLGMRRELTKFMTRRR